MLKQALYIQMNINHLANNEKSQTVRIWSVAVFISLMIFFQCGFSIHDQILVDNTW